jgi:hypothetical protein
MTQAFIKNPPHVSPADTESESGTTSESGTAPRRAGRVRQTALAVIAAAVVVAAVYPAVQPKFWSWDWYWVDQHAQGNTRWGGPFYDVLHHANPLPVEVQWYRATLVVLGQNPLAHHVLGLLGFLATLAVLYHLIRRLGVPRGTACWAVVLAGVAPAALTSWTWFAASPHLWAALLGLASAVLYLAWRQGGSRSRLMAAGAVILTVLGLAMKNDAIIGPLLVVAWEWLAPAAERKPGRGRVTAVALLPVAVFVWWQFTAVDPHRDQARTGLSEVISNVFGLLRFSFLWRNDAELRAEMPPGPSAPVALTVAGALVGAAVLMLAALSLRHRAGRTLVAAGLASLGPVAVLHPALVSRYVLPPTLLITAAAGMGAAILVRPQARRGGRTAIALLAGISAIAVWGVLTHLASGAGGEAGREEQALLAGLAQSGLDPAEEAAVRLVNSPVEPSTAEFRQLDPTLPPEQQLRRLHFLLPQEQPAPGLPLAVATRLPSGRYQVTTTRESPPQG